MPVDKVGILSFAAFSWMTGIMWKAYRKGLKAEDLPRISPLDSCEYNARRWAGRRERVDVFSVVLGYLIALFGLLASGRAIYRGCIHALMMCLFRYESALLRAVRVHMSGSEVEVNVNK